MSKLAYRPPPPREEFRLLVEGLVVEHEHKTVCDLGGGANPVLSEQFIKQHGLRYILVDVSEDELAWAPASYEKVVADMAVEPFTPFAQCDLAISHFVLEHIVDPARFHRNVQQLLREGGSAAHFFSTLYSLPFLVNWVLPGRVSDRLAGLMIPERQVDGTESVFPASYRWCLGPVARQFRRFRSVGYDVEEYVGYFGHSYFRRWRPLQRLEYAVARLLVQHPVATLTSFAYVVLVKRER